MSETWQVRCHTHEWRRGRTPTQPTGLLKVLVPLLLQHPRAFIIPASLTNTLSSEQRSNLLTALATVSPTEQLPHRRSPDLRVRRVCLVHAETPRNDPGHPLAERPRCTTSIGGRIRISLVWASGERVQSRVRGTGDGEEVRR